MTLLNNLNLKFGASIKGSALDIPLTPVTVFVGPNNSGKSLILNEIASCFAGSNSGQYRIVSRLEPRTLSQSEIEALVGPRELSRRTDVHGKTYVMIRSLGIGHVGPGSGPHEIQLTDAIRLASEDPEKIFSMALSSFSLTLNGRTRLDLVNDKEVDDFEGPPKSVLAVLFKDDNLRQKVRDALHPVFGRYFTCDPTQGGKLRLRYANVSPSVALERGLTEDSIAFHRSATLIQQMSDGVQSFTGIVIAVFASGARCFQIDEPEAFLHPPLARRLGRIVTDQVSASDSTAFVSTHSSNFLMGAIESGQPINVVRLTYQNELPSARILESADLQVMMRDPLLRSTDVLDALFHSGCVITEADADRAFYQEINLRLASAKRMAAEDTLFMNGVGKGTISRIIRPLRSMGIPAAAIVDLDIIEKDGELIPLLRSAFMSEVDVDNYAAIASKVNKAFVAGKIEKKVSGIYGLPEPAKTECLTLIERLAEFGLFVVPVGEPERWLTHLGIMSHGNKWLQNMFSALGDDPQAVGYVSPSEGDVWEFMSKVGSWINRPDRFGIPN